MDAPTVQNLSKGQEIVIYDPMMKVDIGEGMGKIDSEVNLVMYKERDIQNCIKLYLVGGERR